MTPNPGARSTAPVSPRSSLSREHPERGDKPPAWGAGLLKPPNPTRSFAMNLFRSLAIALGLTIGIGAAVPANAQTVADAPVQTVQKGESVGVIAPFATYAAPYRVAREAYLEGYDAAVVFEDGAYWV